MRVEDSKEGPSIARLVLLVDNDVLRPSNLLSITDHNDSNLIDIGIGKVIATCIRIWIKVKRDLTTLIRWQDAGQLECLLIKVKSRMQTLGRKNGASLVDKLSTQDV